MPYGFVERVTGSHLQKLLAQAFVRDLVAVGVVASNDCASDARAVSN